MPETNEIERGEKVSIRYEGGGVGVGYLYNGIVYVPLGNGMYHDAREEFFPATHYIVDSGTLYKESVNKRSKASVIVKTGIKI